MAAAERISALSDVDEIKQKTLIAALPDLTQQTARTAVSVDRVRSILPTLGTTATRVIREIVVDIASKAIINQIFPGSGAA